MRANLVMFLFGLAVAGGLASYHYERKVADLRVKAECAYHEGEADGYATGFYRATSTDRTSPQAQRLANH